MTVTRTQPRRKTASKAESTISRPVTETLLELAYLMHATKVVGVREGSRPLPTATAPHSR